MLNKYEIVKEVGNGNFSKVYLVRNKENQQFFAMKIMKTHQNIGVREAQFLKIFDHPNIVKLYDFEQEISIGETKIVLQYFPQNTLELYENQQFGLRQEQIKCILFQAALGLAYIHEKGIIHRDIKPQNIVIDKSKAQIMLIDFGLAIYSDRISTDYVATRWYRAPQNLLGTKEYTTAIDVFSLACVIIQLYLGSPLFPGDDNLDQLYKIFNILGQPTQRQWPSGYKKLKQMGFKIDNSNSKDNKQGAIKFGLKQILNTCNEGLFKILSQMLVLNPKKRMTSKQIVLSEYFNNVSSIIPPHIYGRFSKDFKKNNKKDVIQNAQNAINNAKNMLSKIQSNIKPIPSFLKQSQSPLNFNQSTNLNERNNMPYLISSARLGVKDGEIYNKGSHNHEFRSQQEQKETNKIHLRQSQPQQNQQKIQQILSFRGFNTIKNNKLSMNQIKKFNQSRSKQKFYAKNLINKNDQSKISQHDNSLKKTTISKSIDLGNRVIYTMNNNSQIQQPAIIGHRKLTHNINNNDTSQDKRILNGNGQIYHYVNNRMTPVKYYQNGQVGMQSPAKNMSVLSNNESIRVTRNNSIINVQQVQQHQEKTPSIIKDSNNSFIRQRISYQPIAGMSPLRNKQRTEMITLNKQQEANLYTKKLYSHLSERNLPAYTPNRDINLKKEQIIDKSNDKIVRNEFYALIKNHNQNNRNHQNHQNVKERQNIMKIKMNQVKNKCNPIKMQNSPQHYQFTNAQQQISSNKLKNVKSLQRKEINDDVVNKGQQYDKFSLNQMKFIKVNDVKNYREPCITMKKAYQPYAINKNPSLFYSNEQDRNISINLNVSIIQAQKDQEQHKFKHNQKRNRI